MFASIAPFCCYIEGWTQCRQERLLRGARDHVCAWQASERDLEVLLGELQEEGAADAVVQEALAVLAQADVLGPVADLTHAPAGHGHPHLPPHALLQALPVAPHLRPCGTMTADPDHIFQLASVTQSDRSIGAAQGWQ